MATRRRYTARERAKAVGVAAVEGVTEAERQTGVPKTTIQDWINRPEYVQLRTTAREVVVQQFWVGIQIGVAEVTAGLRGDAPLHHKASALVALAEKYALLNGEPTARTETRDLTEVFDDHEKSVLGEAIRGELARRSDEHTAEAAVGPAGEAGAEGPTG